MPSWTINVNTISGFEIQLEVVAETDLDALEKAIVLLKNDPDTPRDAVHMIHVGAPH